MVTSRFERDLLCVRWHWHGRVGHRFPTSAEAGLPQGIMHSWLSISPCTSEGLQLPRMPGGEPSPLLPRHLRPLLDIFLLYPKVIAVYEVCTEFYDEHTGTSILSVVLFIVFFFSNGLRWRAHPSFHPIPSLLYSPRLNRHIKRTENRKTLFSETSHLISFGAYSSADITLHFTLQYCTPQHQPSIARHAA